MNVAQKLISSHLLEGEMQPGSEIGLKIDQTLTQDATGTLVMLELAAMHLERAQTEVSAQYVDHNLLQEDFKNPDDHLFLQSACQKFGLWFSRPGNGVSHPLHQERFGAPGKTLLGSDSHSCAAGAIGMLAMGAGGIDVAMAICGYPLYVKMPEIWGVRLSGQLPDWVSAKDVILEMLRRHSVKGGVGRIVEYYGDGLAYLSAMDRHVIANMGAELGATTSVFPSDEVTRSFLRGQGREDAWSRIVADQSAGYDVNDEIDLSSLEPMIAMPSSPDNVRPVREVAGEPIYQAYVGSSANPGYRDFAVVAEIIRNRSVASGLSLDINPTSRQILQNLVADGYLQPLLQAGARIHQAGCNGCIGMGQAPATDRISLRTVPRNFPGRSGTREDRVCLVSPETAAASALAGAITDPRDLQSVMSYPRIDDPAEPILNTTMLQEPLDPEDSSRVELVHGPNIVSIPAFEPLPYELEVTVALQVGDNISTDEIMPAGARVLPFRSNIPAISDFVFEQVDETYGQRATELRDHGGHAIVAGRNYGQGSSREHAALAPRYLGLRLVIAISFSRIHWQNLVNFGILPLTFANPNDYDRIYRDDQLQISTMIPQLRNGPQAIIENSTRETSLIVEHTLSERQIEIIRTGGLINWVRENQ
ncbi:aconitate hydratase [Allorhodopirellula solitaria]|nr:aconitate hydratase [Allorhodopirellula solitaria]